MNAKIPRPKIDAKAVSNFSQGVKVTSSMNPPSGAIVACAVGGEIWLFDSDKMS